MGREVLRHFKSKISHRKELRFQEKKKSLIFECRVYGLYSRRVISDLEMGTMADRTKEKADEA